MIWIEFPKNFRAILMIDGWVFSYEIVLRLTLRLISQHWFRYWLGADRQQAITWGNVDPDLCHRSELLGHNELRQERIYSGPYCCLETLNSDWNRLEPPGATQTLWLVSFILVTMLGTATWMPNLHFKSVYSILISGASIFHNLVEVL